MNLTNALSQAVQRRASFPAITQIGRSGGEEYDHGCLVGGGDGGQQETRWKASSYSSYRRDFAPFVRRSGQLLAAGFGRDLLFGVWEISWMWQYGRRSPNGGFKVTDARRLSSLPEIFLADLWRRRASPVWWQGTCLLNRGLLIENPTPRLLHRSWQKLITHMLLFSSLFIYSSSYRANTEYSFSRVTYASNWVWTRAWLQWRCLWANQVEY